MAIEERMTANWLTSGSRITAWLLAAIIVTLSLVPPVLRPETAAPHDLEHFAIFALNGLAFGLGYDRRPVILGILLVIFCGTVEIAQLFAPGRHARLEDFLIDSAAMCAGVAVARVLGKIRTRLQ